jgi:phosphodiesterase/alkaline phosphatase D-like protein
MTTNAVTGKGADASKALDNLPDSLGPAKETGFVLRLPALGPIIGWTSNDGGRLKARVWIKPDDTGSDLPIAMLTVRCGGGGAKGGSAQVWQVFRVESEDSDGEKPVIGYCGLADLDFESGDPDAAYWVLGVHRIWMQRGSVAEQSGEGQTQQAVAASRRMPPWALEIAKRELVALQASFEPRRWLDGPAIDDAWVNEAVRYLREHLAEQDARATAPLRTLSREKRKTGSLDDCEVRLAAAPMACATGAQPLRFAAVCCRYPTMSIDRTLAERPLRTLAALADRVDEGPGLVVMAGDQIYADVWAGLLDIRDRLEKYTARYQHAFSTPAFRQLASRVPLYMAADDHEVEDAWPKSRSMPGSVLTSDELWKQDYVKWAWKTYLGHQRAHGPAEPETRSVTPPRTPCFWYDFPAGQGAAAARFLMLDTRFERECEGGAWRLMSDAQWEHIEGWLEQRLKDPDPHAPKFIVSGSVFAPGLARFAASAADPAAEMAAARRADSWQGFPEERARLARRIAELGLTNVVFVSGDYHCAAVADIALFRDGAATESVRAYAVVAPPLYAPFPFVNTRAREVARHESVFFPSGDARRLERVAESRAQALEISSGFAMVACNKVGDHGTPDDWEIRVEFHKAAWDAARNPASEIVATAHLAKGEAKLARGR